MPTTFGTRDDAKDPGPWPHKILEIGMVASKKKLCCLCELWFSVENLTGVASWKAVLMKKASFGDKEAEKRVKDPKTSPSRLYSAVPLCCFCTQLLAPDPDEPEEVAKSPKKKALPSSTSEDLLASGSLKPSTFLATFKERNGL